MQTIDLSQVIQSRMDVYPGDPKVHIENVQSIKKEGWRLSKLSLGSHTGTHVDSFSHMDPCGTSLDKTPLERFFGKAQVATIDANLPKKIGLIFIDTKLKVTDFDTIKQALPPFIAVSKECDFDVELERKLLKEGIVTFTDLVNIDLLPIDKSFMFFGFPLKIVNGDGSPVRAVAIVE